MIARPGQGRECFGQRLVAIHVYQVSDVNRRGLPGMLLPFSFTKFFSDPVDATFRDLGRAKAPFFENLGGMFAGFVVADLFRNGAEHGHRFVGGADFHEQVGRVNGFMKAVMGGFGSVEINSG